MNQEVDNALLLRLNDHFAVHIGLHLPHNRLPDFKRNLKAAAKEFNMEPHECAEWLLNSKSLTKDRILSRVSFYNRRNLFFSRSQSLGSA